MAIYVNGKRGREQGRGGAAERKDRRRGSQFLERTHTSPDTDVRLGESTQTSKKRKKKKKGGPGMMDDEIKNQKNCSELTLLNMYL